MKAMIVVLSPREGYFLLKGDLSILIRKIKPNCKLPVKVYAYVKNERKTQLLKGPGLYDREEIAHIAQGGLLKTTDFLNGKVIARFWCDKVEHIEYETCSRDISGWWKDNGKMFNYKYACLTYVEMFNYIGSGDGYAIHITEVKPFDEPKEISEFMKTIDNFDGLDCWRCSKRHNCSFNKDKKCEKLKLTRAPRNYCYVED